MPKFHPPYPTEFRQQMVELVRAGRTPIELAEEFGCSDQTIRNWVAQSAIDNGNPLPGKVGLTSAEREELTRLRRQVRQLQMERDILAKARPGSPARAGGRPRPLRTREREPGRLPSAHAVPGIEGVAEWLLRLALPAAVEAGDG